MEKFRLLPQPQHRTSLLLPPRSGCWAPLRCCSARFRPGRERSQPEKWGVNHGQLSHQRPCIQVSFRNHYTVGVLNGPTKLLILLVLRSEPSKCWGLQKFEPISTLAGNSPTLVLSLSLSSLPHIPPRLQGHVGLFPLCCGSITLLYPQLHRQLGSQLPKAPRHHGIQCHAGAQ